jgi:peptide/nickel transport system ATP-binding protein
MSDGGTALDVRAVTVTVPAGHRRRVTVVDDVSFSVPAGGTLGLVGESGSGKSMTSLAIMGVLPHGARLEGGSVIIDDQDLTQLKPSQLRHLRGATIAMVLQDAMTALDPCFTVTSQISQPLRRHRELRGADLGAAIVGAMQEVELPTDEVRLKQFPHQFSGGMRQRAASAIALAGRPGVLIADEPTTSMDVITQARYLRLLRDLQESSNFALILVTHDLLIVQRMCEQVVVMYAGQVVETGSVTEIFASPQHPYTTALLGAIPVSGGVDDQLQGISGSAPDAGAWGAGCRFADRCEFARPQCSAAMPQLTGRGDGRASRCFGTEPGGWIAR